MLLTLGVAPRLDHGLVAEFHDRWSHEANRRRRPHASLPTQTEPQTTHMIGPLLLLPRGQQLKDKVRGGREVDMMAVTVGT